MDSSTAETIYAINSDPRSEPKPLPVFPNPSRRPDGTGPALVLDFFSEVPKGVDIALGRAARRDTLAFLRAISEAGDRTIECRSHRNLIAARCSEKSSAP